MSAALTCSSSFYDEKETFCFSLQDIFFRRGQFVTSHKKLGPCREFGIWDWRDRRDRKDRRQVNNQFKLSLPLNIDNLAFIGPEKEKIFLKLRTWKGSRPKYGEEIDTCTEPLKRPTVSSLFLNAIYNQLQLLQLQTKLCSDPVLSCPLSLLT